MAESVRHPITLKPIVYRVPDMDRVRTTGNVEYASSPAGPLTFDLYRPADSAAVLPVVVLVAGYADAGVRAALGCAFKEMAAVTSTARLLAASGLAAVTYTTRAPADDAGRVLDGLMHQATALQVDPSRLALWATSGNVPVALGLLTRGHAPIRAAVLSNGLMFDADGLVAQAARTYRFANPVAGQSAADLPPNVPLFIVRSGLDAFAGVNESIDGFLTEAVARNLPLTFVNHAVAPHAFEIHDDSDHSRAILAQAVAFLRLHLLKETEQAEGTEC